MTLLSQFLGLAALALVPGTDWRGEVEALDRGGELGRAIEVAYAHLDQQPGDADAWRWLAGAFERLVEDEEGATLLLHDAAAAWDEVAALRPDDDEALAAAAADRFAAGDFARAEAGALRAARLQVERDGAAASATAGLALRARSAAFAATTHGDAAAFARDVIAVRATAQEVRALAPEGAEPVLVEAEWLASVHLADVGIASLRSALGDAPASIALHRGFIDRHVAAGIEERLPDAYAGLAAAFPDEAIVHWYAGYVARVVGDLAARERRNTDARASYEACVTSMRRAAALDPSFGETALVAEMQARTGAGWAALDGGDLPRAEEQWSAVLGEGREFASLHDGLGRTPTEGLGRLGGRFHARDELVAAERISRSVAGATEEPWSWNNVAYLIREIAGDAEATEGEGGADQVRSLYQESWETYKKAAELAPDEPRIINDAALIQVYHLQSDLEGAESMLFDAIRIGEEQLQRMGPYAESTETFPVAQVVGDAYQNLGYLHYRLLDDPRKAREFFVRSLRTDSGVRRGVRASIQAIDRQLDGALGEAGPGRDRPLDPATPDPTPPAGPQGSGGSPRAGTRPPLPEEGPPEQPGEGGSRVTEERAPRVRWERSIDVALEAAEGTGARVLVYHRVGGGLGPSVEYLQRYLHGAAFEEATRGAVTVLADGLRHTFSDRRRDGRLVPCPRAGGVTCAEHIACAAEFEQRWRALEGTEVGRSSNGLFEVGPSGLARIGRVQDVFERFRPIEGRAEEVPSGGAPNALLEPDGSQIEALARSVSLPARRALERILFDARSADERRRAVQAVAGHPGRDNDGLLVALARQHADAELAALALGAWRADLGSSAPAFALETSPSASVRAVAAEALAGLGDDRATRALVARWAVAAGGMPEKLEKLDLRAVSADLGREGGSR